jgi:hypothetical protein
MSWKENSLLFLSTENIDPDYTKEEVNNKIGGWSQNRRRFWFYIDFLTLLGDLYEKYDEFNMSMIYIITDNPEGNATAIVSVYTSGLDWINGGYNAKQQSNNSLAYLCPLFIQVAGNITGEVEGEKDGNVLAFRKPINTARLEFEYRSITNENQTFTSSNGKYPVVGIHLIIRPSTKPKLYLHNLSIVSANLILNTYNISQSTAQTVNNQIGSWGPAGSTPRARQVFSFNVNMRTLLGDLWQNNKIFAFSFVQCLSLPVGSMGTPNPRLTLYMSGLNFRNTYYQQSGNGSTKVMVWTRRLVGNAVSGTVTDKDTRQVTFVKGADNVRLEFECIDFLTNQPLVPVNLVDLPHFYFKINIYPIA